MQTSSDIYRVQCWRCISIGALLEGHSGLHVHIAVVAFHQAEVKEMVPLLESLVWMPG